MFIPLRAIFEVAISQPELDMPEVKRKTIYGVHIAHQQTPPPTFCLPLIQFCFFSFLFFFLVVIAQMLWKAFIDFELNENESERVRVLYTRLLERTSHLKVLARMRELFSLYHDFWL